MPQQPIELILFRQMASYLDTPAFLVGADGELLYFNDAAEAQLGTTFTEVDEMPLGEWLATFLPIDEHGAPMAHEKVPLVVALRESRAVHERVVFIDRRGERHAILVTSFPLRGQNGRTLGAVAFFWPDDGPPAEAPEAASSPAAGDGSDVS
jgi:PAS domain S-box-containing protein